ncbi:MAG: hypothetical protein H0U92_11560, partial [Actinobacteria bacterium]|nr:hypothetical protein [Actinomycetota bacterium]
MAFGPQIREGCDHAMVAAANACYCAECGVKCTSKFPGCRDVWAGQPPIPATFVELTSKAYAADSPNGSAAPEVANRAPVAQVNGNGASAPAPQASTRVEATALGDEEKLDLEKSLNELRSLVTQLVSTVEQLVEADQAMSDQQDALGKSVAHIDEEVAKVSTRVERLAAATGDTLKMHKEALQLVMKRLHSLSQGGRQSAPPKSG